MDLEMNMEVESETTGRHVPLKVPEGMTCLATWEDISIEDGTYCEYKTVPSGTWHAAKYCTEVIDRLLRDSFKKYLEDVEKATKDCAASLRRLINLGPPVYLTDSEALPIPEGDTHIETLWISEGNRYVSAMLQGALLGEEREELWRTQKEVLSVLEKAEASEK